jgi:hypothetical protein
VSTLNNALALVSRASEDGDEMNFTQSERHPFGPTSVPRCETIEIFSSAFLVLLQLVNGSLRLAVAGTLQLPGPVRPVKMRWKTGNSGWARKTLTTSGTRLVNARTLKSTARNDLAMVLASFPVELGRHSPLKAASAGHSRPKSVCVRLPTYDARVLRTPPHLINRASAHNNTCAAQVNPVSL